MNRYPTLTAADLKAADACPEQVEVFRATFPTGAPLTVAALRTAQAAGLYVLWAECLLDGPAREEYRKAIARAWGEYRKATIPAWGEYEQVRASAHRDHQEAIAPAREAYQQALAPAWEEYQQALAPAWEEYQKAATSAREAYQQAIAPAWEEYDNARNRALLAALRSTFTRKEGTTS